MEVDLKNASESVNSSTKNTEEKTEKYEGSLSGMRVVLYLCDQCTYKAKYKSTLRKHMESIHEGLCYSCDHCGFRSTRKSSLARHVKSEHEGIRYSCDQCVYNTKWKGELKQHTKSKHEGVHYSCEQCELI